MILITGATGKLGSFIVSGLLDKGVTPSKIAVLARDPGKAAHFEKRGIEVRQGDYTDPASLASALSGIETLMFVSSSEFGERARAHQNVISAAKSAGVKLIVYTSILRADSSPMALAGDHRATERALRESAVPHVLLRNGWYYENYTENLGPALEHGVIMGAGGTGKYAMATRKDYADAAVAVLTSTEEQAGKVYELGGRPAVTLSELAAEVARQSEKNVAYLDFSPEDFRAKLESLGLPTFVAELLADADAAASKGFLDTDRDDLKQLIGRPKGSLAEAVASGLRG